jgi:hypothetical protein
MCPPRYAGFIAHAGHGRTSVALEAEAFSHVDPALYAMQVGITEQHPAGTYWDSLEPTAKGKKGSTGRHESLDCALEAESGHNFMTSSRISAVFLACYPSAGLDTGITVMV